MKSCSVFALALAILGFGQVPVQAASDPSAPAEVREAIHPDWFKESLLDLGADLREARDAGKTGVLVYFGTRSCSYCHALLTTTFARPDLVERLLAGFDVIGIEVLSDEEVMDFQGRSLWAKDFAVQEKAPFTPTLVFYGEDGRVLLRLVGYVPPERFSLVLDYLQERRYEHQGLRAYLAERESASPTPGGRGLVRDADLFTGPPHDLDRRGTSGRPLLVLFERPDCPACERLHRTVLTVPSVRELVGRFDAVQLDTTDTRTRVVTPDGAELTPAEWAARLGLIHEPALVFFDEQGVEAVRADSELLIDPRGVAVDAVDPRIVDNVEARLRYVLEKGYVDQPQFQRWRSRSAPESTGG
jgi:thioredoxin-related protein